MVAATPAGSLISADITVSAVVLTSSSAVTADDFQYILYSDKTAKVVGYTDVKNCSSSVLSMPSVICSKDIRTTGEYNQYISSYAVSAASAAHEKNNQ